MPKPPPPRPHVPPTPHGPVIPAPQPVGGYHAPWPGQPHVPTVPSAPTKKRRR